MATKAIYAGSFDPFTNGHLDIVRKAAKLFDEVHVVIGINLNKKRTYKSVAMSIAINEVLKEEGLDNVKVCVCDGLIADYAKLNGVQYLVRGLRNQIDFGYEETIAETNKLLYPELETVYFRAENCAISSSMVTELHSFGTDVSAFLPTAVWKLVEGSGGL